MTLTYSLIVLMATVIGSVAGIGGGVIIKPVFDMFNYHDSSTISLYSSFIVLSMSTIAMIKLIKRGVKFNKKIIVLMVLGSIIGGINGQLVFSLLANSNKYSQYAGQIQNILLLISLLAIILYYLYKNRIKSYKINNPITIFSIGFILGFISIFLGIGGGPLNIFLLGMFFSYDQRESAVYSIAIIFFSQIAKFATLLCRDSIINYDLSMVPILCIVAIIGGYVGITLNRKISVKSIEKIYITTIIGLIFICIKIINKV